eukprot:306175_1
MGEGPHGGVGDGEPQGPDVTVEAVGLRLVPLRRHEFHGANAGGLRDATVPRLRRGRYPKISQFSDPGLVYQDVLGLDVPVCDVEALVEVDEAMENLFRDRSKDHFGEGVALGAPTGEDVPGLTRGREQGPEVSQCPMVHVLEEEMEGPIQVERIVVFDDVIGLVIGVQ